RKREVKRLAGRCPGAEVIEFTNAIMNYMKAADVVVAMAGYNTICEILTLRKRAVIVPRVAPVEEQKIRAERMAQRALFKMIHPDELTPQALIGAVKNEVEVARTCPYAPTTIDLNALPRISAIIRQLTWRVADAACAPQVPIALSVWG